MAGKSKKDDAHERAVEEAREQIRAELRGESGGKTGKTGKTSKSSKYGYGGGYARSRNGKLIPFIGGLIIGLIVGALLLLLIGNASQTMFFGTNHTSTTNADTVFQQGMLGTYTAADFEKAILGEASRHKELVVKEQPIEIPTTITRAGLGNLQIFSKVQNVYYYGTGVYTISLAELDASNIRVDEENQKVRVMIPHACLQYINPNLDLTMFEEAGRGLLAFGDIKMTTQEQNSLQQSVVESMRERLTQEDMYLGADEFAKVSAWEIFQPLVASVSPSYLLEIMFDENTIHQDLTH
ncbi:MAG: DUF4230 domain-containing protein [Lachnospiraceae bacterium]|nr:DUF4230 domain-containing protein [Lachnospiraceae bacterium]